jgi:putative ABC transport system permease protein
MLIFKIAFRNIFRQRRRSIFTALTMVGGYVLFSLSLSVSEGTYGTIIDKFTKSYTGHIQFHKKGYFDKPSLYKTLDDFDFINEKIKKVEGVKSSSPRVYSSVLASKDNKTSIARIVGIIPEKEAETTLIKEKIKKGTYLKYGPEFNNDVMIGTVLADLLKLKVGDDLVLVGQGADGSVANDVFKVSAILKGDNYSIDRNYCYMNIKSAQSFLALESRFHEVVISLFDFNKSRTKVMELNKVFKEKPEIDILPWQLIEKQFYNTMIFEKRGIRICLLVIVFIVAVGVLNTVLMTIFERTKEYGVLRALGTRPIMVFNLIVLESAILACISILVGFLLSFILNYLLSIYGIDYPAPMDIGGFTVTAMYGLIYPGAFTLPAMVTFFTAIIVSIFPAFRAMKIVPVDAMRIM